MSIFKRLSTTLFSRIDEVVSEIENHDAVVQVTLADMRKKVAEAKVRLNRVHLEQNRLKKEVTEQEEKSRQWRNRAVECAKNNEAKALECVSRSRHCDQQVERLGQALNQYQQTAVKLAGDIDLTEQRLAEIKQKLTLMRARQSTSSALNATNETNTEATQLLEDTFDRWEINISQAEMTIDSQQFIDPIEHEFVAREQEQDLRNELEMLIAREGKQ